MGGINGLYQVIGEMLQPLRDKAVRILHLNRQSIGHKLMQMLISFIMVDFSWVFFRASTFRSSIETIKSMISVWNPWILFDQSLFDCGLDRQNFQLMLLAIVVLAFADVCKYRGIKIREIILIQDYWFRWLFFAFSVTFILTYGIWGTTYNEANFIYFQF